MIMMVTFSLKMWILSKLFTTSLSIIIRVISKLAFMRDLEMMELRKAILLVLIQLKKYTLELIFMIRECMLLTVDKVNTLWATYNYLEDQLLLIRLLSMTS